MRVLLTTDTVGGVWTFTKELTGQLLKSGHSVALLSFGRAASSTQRTWVERIAALFGECFFFRACEAPLEWMQDNQNAYAHGAEDLLREVRDFRPDLLHSSQFCWGALPLEIPVLITAHSDVMSWAEACRPDVLHGSDWLSRYCTLVQQGLHGANAAVAPTVWMRHALCAHFDPPSRFEVIGNGRTVAPASKHAPRQLRAVSVGRFWDEAKGLSALLNLDVPVPIFLAGERQFGDASVSANSTGLQTLGPLGEADLFNLFRSSAIYIAPSVYEPFGLAPLEAANCGCALVVRDIASFREIWADAALYFKTSAELEHILCTLAQDGRRLEAAQQASRQRAMHFTAERMAQSYHRLYRRLLAGSGERSQPPVEESVSHAA